LSVFILFYSRTILFTDQGDVYICPHCPPESTPEISFSNLEFHLRCHGEMLYKCGHCLYYHWQKRTAEKHVAENHYGFKQYVRDVRLEAERVITVLVDHFSVYVASEYFVYTGITVSEPFWIKFILFVNNLKGVSVSQFG